MYHDDVDDDCITHFGLVLRIYTFLTHCTLCDEVMLLLCYYYDKILG